MSVRNESEPGAFSESLSMSFVSPLWLGLQGIRRADALDERDAHAEARLAYLERPECERELELMTMKLAVAQEEDELFRQNFDYSCPAVDTTARCRHCAFSVTGSLAYARREGATHAVTAREFSAVAYPGRFRGQAEASRLACAAQPRSATAFAWCSAGLPKPRAQVRFLPGAFIRPREGQPTKVTTRSNNERLEVTITVAPASTLKTRPFA